MEGEKDGGRIIGELGGREGRRERRMEEGER